MNSVSATQPMHRINIPARLTLFLALGVGTGLACGLIVVRWRLTGDGFPLFLIWNLFLAWVPLWLALAAEVIDVSRLPARGVALAVAGGTWLLYLPNTLYLTTDLMHLRNDGGLLFWLDLMLYFSAAWTGVMLGLVSLRLMHNLVARRLGAWLGWLFVLVSLGLSSFGVYLGRFLRWNSWDVMRRPLSLAADILARALQPTVHPRTVLVTLLFTAFSLTAYLMFLTVGHLQPEPHPAQES